MSAYTHQRRRASRTAIVLRIVARVLRSGWTLLLLAVLASPIGPHVIVRYEFDPPGFGTGARHCDYIGSRGLVHTTSREPCWPVIVLDRRHVGWRFPWPDSH